MSAADPTPARAPVTLDQARHALRQGSAVVLPNPAPLTHVVAATTATAVNRAKHRPADQPVALWAHHHDTLDTLTGLWDLAPQDCVMTRRLLAEEHLTVLLPVRAHATLPSWLEPAVKEGWMLLFGARRRPLRALLDDHPVLYVSSANLTGHPPAADTGEALAMFPPAVPVLHLPDPEHPRPRTGTRGRRATTTVRVTPDGQLRLHRHGAQDQPHADADDYLRHLHARCTGSASSRVWGVPTESDEAAMSERTKPEVDVPEGDAPTELTVRDLVVGDGPEVKPGMVVRVHYVGVTFESGKEFDASWDRGQPFKFALGSGKVIKGWDRGVRGMKVGGRREIIVPPRLGYGNQSPSPLIPAGSTLVFVVDLLDSYSSTGGWSSAR